MPIDPKLLADLGLRDIRLYDVSLFVHMLGLIALFGGLILLQHGGRCLRGSATWEEARSWLSLLRRVRGMFVGAALMLLLSGVYMTYAAWSFDHPWVIVGLAMVALIPLLALPIGRSLAQITAVARSTQGPVALPERGILTAPRLWTSVFTLNGMSLGLVWVMSTKPGWVVSLAVPVALGLAGAVLGFRPRRRGRYVVRLVRPATLPAGDGQAATGR